MFETTIGPVKESGATAYLRPETAQGIFINFKNVLQFARKKPPFGIAQVGKSFRNEITPGNFIFRTREFEQMEMEFFVPPADAQQWFEHWLGGARALVRGARDPARPPAPARRTTPTSSRTTPRRRATSNTCSRSAGRSSRGSPTAATSTSRATRSSPARSSSTSTRRRGERYVPHVIEPAAGADRATLAFLVDAYDEEVVEREGTGEGETRTVLRLHPRLAPVKAAVLPLVSKDGQPELAREVHRALRGALQSEYDEGGAIGRRYRRQDEIGTPFCLTIDHQSLEDRTVTVRDRDSLAQERLPIDGIADEIERRIEAPWTTPKQLKGAGWTST